MSPRGADDRIPDVVRPPSVPAFEYSDISKQERIGRGGDADVYLATVDIKGRNYSLAIKEPRFNETLHRKLVERFQTEAERWGLLDDHENIVTIYQWESEPIPWLALEYMDAGSLERKLGSADISEVLWLSGRIAEGIRHGHRHGIAHLDIKPANVLLRETGDQSWEYPKVSDWGLAKMLLEHSNSIEGLSPRYAAPEQFDSAEFGEPDDITDVYQLGAVVYALLTGNPPFTGGSAAVMQKVIQKPPTPPSEVENGVPAEVDEIVLKALAKRKEDRYESILPFRRALDRLFEKSVGAETRGADSAVGDDVVNGESRGSPSRTGADDNETEAPSEQTRRNRSNSSILTRRRALGALGLGVVGGGAWIGSTRSGTSDSNAAETGTNSVATRTQTDSPTPTSTATATPTETSTATAPGVSAEELDNETQEELEQIFQPPEPAVTIAVGPGGALTFDPQTATISQGDMVEWRFETSGHNVSGHPDASSKVSLPQGSDPFASYDLNSSDPNHLATSEEGTSYVETFETPGEYWYVCAHHASSGMIGSLTVE